ncbi:MAG: peptidoglycan glycosyltransferase [Firmicutes bacterium]|nr:peptidoglycan glycosyltransferase [Bacillota bacterium]
MNTKRGFIVLIIFFTLFILLAVRMFHLQVGEREKLSRAASVQRIANARIEKARGDILDRNGIPLTNRSEKYIIVLKPLILKEDKNSLKRISDILGTNFQKLEEEVEKGEKPILIEVDKERKNLVKSLECPGISIINSLYRYDNNSVAKHILGYVNKSDGNGEAGIEKFYNKTLACDSWYMLGVVTDGRNNILPGMGYRLIRAEGENKKLNVKLTIDYHIQKIVEEVMERNNVTGAIVVEEVNSGDVVAIASKPDFNQDNVSQYLNSPNNELFNKAVASYNLGSIFKIIDAAAMFELKDSWEEEYLCTGSIKVGDREFKCYSYKDGGHGLLDLKKAFALSCNTYFIDAALNKINAKSLIEMAKRFGLGSFTGIRSQGIEESAGNLPSIDTWFSGGDIANISIGQGEIMATPLQVADMVATVANGGIKNTINIVDSIVDENGNKVRDIRQKQGKRIINKDIANKIKNLMESVINEGTGTMINLEEYGGAAGKTGSAETGQYKDGESIVHAWFAGYFPKKNPKYSIAVFIENGKVGGKTAGPIFQEIAWEIMKKGF